MNANKGFNALKNQSMVLSEEHRLHGLTLWENEDFVCLFKNGKPVATWSNSPALTIVEIHREADKFIGGDAVKQLLELGAIGFASDYV